MDIDPKTTQTETIHSDLSQIDSNVPAAMTTHLRPPEGKLQFLKSWKFWAVTTLFIVSVVLALWFVQPSRLWMVNTLGLRAPFTATTRTQAQGDQPSSLLKNVTVTVGGLHLSSNEQGEVKGRIMYGLHKIVATKQGYDEVTTTEFYDFDPFFNMLTKKESTASQPIDIRLKSIGVPLSFKVVDWLSGQPITTGEFSVGDVVATPNGQGILQLQAPPSDSQTITVVARFKNGAYIERQFELLLPVDPTHTELFVPSGKAYFISRQNGNLGVYQSNFDGTNTKAFIEPSANETTALSFAVSPGGTYAVLASSREGKKVSGRTVQKLYVVTMATGQLTAVDEADWFDLVDWSGNNIVYVTARNGQGQVLVSLDVSQNKKTDMATAASFSSVRVSLGAVLYVATLSADQADIANSPVLRLATINSTAEKTIGSKVQALTQNDFDSFAYQTADNSWHSYNVNTGMVGNTNAPKSMERFFLNSASPDGQNRLLVDKIDGKMVILTKSIATGVETPIPSMPGLVEPLHWASATTIIFNSSLDSAQYITSTQGQQPKKISDITLPQSSLMAGFQFY